MDHSLTDHAGGEKADLTIAICTYHREQLLAKALASIIAQECPAELRIRIVVIDNSDTGTARQIVQDIGKTCPVSLRWIEAHPANISIARNIAVTEANADFLAFIDDDQQVQPGWLTAVAKAMKTLPHDAFFGAVTPDFEAPGNPNLLVRQLFSRTLDEPAGHDLCAMGPQKTEGLVLATCNSVFRVSSLPQEQQLFDPAFGSGGGEDYDLICRMQHLGCRFGWLPEARAREFVTAARCKGGYLRRRFFAGGQAYAAVIANCSPTPGFTRWILRAKALAQAGLLIVKLPVVALRGYDGFADYCYIWAGVLGKLSQGKIYPLYRR